MKNLTAILKIATMMLLCICLPKLIDAQSYGLDKAGQNLVAYSDLVYLGQKPPGNTPEIFAPGIISKEGRYEFGCSFSVDAKELFFGVDNNGVMEIHHTKLENGVWTNQQKLFKNSKFSHNDPMYSPDEKKLFFISNRPMDPSGQSKDVDIWYITLEDDNWSDPINAGPAINSDQDEYFVSFADNGTMYFSSKESETFFTRKYG